MISEVSAHHGGRWWWNIAAHIMGARKQREEEEEEDEEEEEEEEMRACWLSPLPIFIPCGPPAYRKLSPTLMGACLPPLS
jgi:hypothetical protein